MTKQIALICQHFYPEMMSTGLLITEVAVGLAQNGWQIRVYSGQPSYRDVSQSKITVNSKMTYQGVEIIRVPSFSDQHSGLLLRGINAISFLLFTTIFLIRDRALLAGIFNTTNPPFLGLAAIIVRWLTGLHFITLIHDVYPDVAICTGTLKPGTFLTSLWEMISGMILRWSDGLIVIGEDMECVIRKKLNQKHSKPIEVIRNWSDEQRVYPVPENKNPFIKRYGLKDKIVIQYSGRMGLTHNLEPLIAAAEILKNEPVIFQFIGGGAKLDILQKMASEYRLSNVQFLPYQPFEDLMNVLSASNLSVVCLETNCTGFSVPSKSYGIMAAGRPILAFLAEESEVGQMIKSFDCGIVIPDPTGQEVAAAILDLLEDPDRMANMGENGYTAFLKHFKLELAVDKYSQFLCKYFPQAKQSMVVG